MPIQMSKPDSKEDLKRYLYYQWIWLRDKNKKRYAIRIIIGEQSSLHFLKPDDDMTKVQQLGVTIHTVEGASHNLPITLDDTGSGYVEVELPIRDSPPIKCQDASKTQ